MGQNPSQRRQPNLSGLVRIPAPPTRPGRSFVPSNRIVESAKSDKTPALSQATLPESPKPLILNETSLHLPQSPPLRQTAAIDSRSAPCDPNTFTNSGNRSPFPPANHPPTCALGADSRRRMYTMRLLLAGMTLACLGQVAHANPYADTTEAPAPAAESPASEPGRPDPGAPTNGVAPDATPSAADAGDKKRPRGKLQNLANGSRVPRRAEGATTRNGRRRFVLSAWT